MSREAMRKAIQDAKAPKTPPIVQNDSATPQMPPERKFIPPQGGSGTAPPKGAKKPKVGRVEQSERKMAKRGRLPDGATFLMGYDAGKKEWLGTLTVEGVQFTLRAGGVFRLLEQLDKMYRSSLVPTEGDKT